MGKEEQGIKPIISLLQTRLGGSITLSFKKLHFVDTKEFM